LSDDTLKWKELMALQETIIQIRKIGEWYRTNQGNLENANKALQELIQKAKKNLTSAQIIPH
jgi:hypothetical protein